MSVFCNLLPIHGGADGRSNSWISSDWPLLAIFSRDWSPSEDARLSIHGKEFKVTVSNGIAAYVKIGETAEGNHICELTGRSYRPSPRPEGAVP